MKALALLVIRFYQRAVSPFLGMRCRYEPTCSDYAYQAIQQRGFLRGGWQALLRLCRCNPLGGKGYDPIR